jgi:RNA polymerase sigma-70 factor (ECF subfamily)
MIDAYRKHRGSAKRSIDREQPMEVASPDQSSVMLAAQLLDPQTTPAAHAIRQEISEQVEAAITELSEADREMINLRHYEHLSNLEIAEVLQVTPAAASMRYLRAVRRLREVLEGKSGESSSSPEDPS